jgi:hypothetical protein
MIRALVLQQPLTRAPFCVMRAVNGVNVRNSAGQSTQHRTKQKSLLEQSSIQPSTRIDMAAASTTSASPMEALLGSSLVDSAGTTYKTADKLAGKDTVVIYFSAHCEKTCACCLRFWACQLGPELDA